MPEPYNAADLDAQRLMREIRAIVNDHRDHQQVSLKELAYRCSVSKNTITGALTRPEYLTIRGLSRITNALGIQVEIRTVDHSVTSFNST